MNVVTVRSRARLKRDRQRVFLAALQLAGVVRVLAAVTRIVLRGLHAETTRDLAALDRP